MPVQVPIEGARVDVEVSEDGRIIIISRSRRRFTLDELLARMTPRREHVPGNDAPRGEELV
jgi:antitoxin component of MazEF toxin-antitoxin module